MRFLCSVALIGMLATPASFAWAQIAPAGSASDNTNDPFTVRTHEDIVVSDKYEPVEARPRVADKKFWFVSAALNSTMLLDTWSTFDVLERCPRCMEANPYVAPFVKRGPAVTFTAGQVFDIGVMALSAKMKASSKPQIRRIWWLVPVAMTTGHIVAAKHNMGLAR